MQGLTLSREYIPQNFTFPVFVFCDLQNLLFETNQFRGMNQ